ncbi:MAG: glutathione S-transferase family protein [Myxococcales bacterium]|nr:glutathione S-transferase family protein [Myxococcales bacterium]
MKLYGFGGPSRATRVAWALEEAGAEWSYQASHPRSDEVKALNPHWKMPILVDGDLVLTESLACCNWVAQRFPEAGLAPALGTRERAEYDRWCSFVVTELEQPLWTHRRHNVVYPEALRGDVTASVDHELGRALKVLEAGLQDRTFLVGDRFTCADILCVHTLSWARGEGFEERLDPALVRYRDGHRSRPAFQRATAREAGA